MILTSKNNPLIKETISLKEKKFRKEKKCFLVEGAKMASECRKSGLEIERVFVSESYRGEADDSAIRVSDEVFARLSDEKTPQGILCVVKIPEKPLCPPRENCLFLDGISDPGNMGAIIRTANAAGYRELYLAECTDPYSPKSVRASMSGIFFVNLYTGTRKEILSALSGLPILAADKICSCNRKRGKRNFGRSVQSGGIYDQNSHAGLSGKSECGRVCGNSDVCSETGTIYKK